MWPAEDSPSADSLHGSADLQRRVAQGADKAKQAQQKRQIVALIQGKHRSGFGPEKARELLCKSGIADSAEQDGYLDALDWLDAARRALHGREGQKVKSQVGFLMRRGFLPEHISELFPEVAAEMGL